MIEITNNLKRFKRAVDGILLLDKPQGMTSNEALQRMKKLFHAKKAGHTGSLDPLATGMLPICLGKATKFAQFLLDAKKSYYVKGRLGIRTSSGDKESQIIAERPVHKITKYLLEKTLSRFRGLIEQTPPMYSALKYKGQPLYKLARRGIEVERKTRQVSIDKLDLLKWGSDFVDLYVYCSKGTYVRTLIDDLGEALGCGAHVVILRRLSVAHYREEQIIPLAQLERGYNKEDEDALDHYLLPLEIMVSHFPVLRLSTTAFCEQQGQAIMVPKIPSIHGFIRLYDVNDHFIGIGEVLSDTRIVIRRLAQIR